MRIHLQCEECDAGDTQQKVGTEFYRAGWRRNVELVHLPSIEKSLVAQQYAFSKALSAT